MVMVFCSSGEGESSPDFRAADTDQQEALFLQSELVACLDKGV